MVRAAELHLRAHCRPCMVNHCMRTAFWALAVLQQHGELSAATIETTWVASLLHDVGLEVPPARGDFSLGGVQALRALVREVGWSEEQAAQAAEAIAVNLSTRVDAARDGPVAWAMNVGGVAELGFGPHRTQLHPDRIAELEARYPRDDFAATAMRLIEEESRRVPDGRFALLGRFFPLVMR